jgi:hypothetical protein
MDKKFLNKVLEQIISESTIDYEMKKVKEYLSPIIEKDELENLVFYI